MTSPANPPSTRSLILVPAIITLAITGIRLALELGKAPDWLASAEPGGPGAVVGIAWLPLIFGPYFAFKLAPHAESTKSLVKQLVRTLFAYGLAARVPVVLLTVVALLADWGTHYEKFPFEGGLAPKLAVTVGAQLIFWAGLWTIASGLLAAFVVGALRSRPVASADGNIAPES